MVGLAVPDSAEVTETEAQEEAREEAMSGAKARHLKISMPTPKASVDARAIIGTMILCTGALAVAVIGSALILVSVLR